MCLQFGFAILWRKDFGTKAAHKMLVKLTPGPYVLYVNTQNRLNIALTISVYSMTIVLRITHFLYARLQVKQSGEISNSE